MGSTRGSYAPQDRDITIVCATHKNHGPYDFSGGERLRNVSRNSLILGGRFRTGLHHISLDCVGKQYDCYTLDSMIKTWRNQEYLPPRRDADVQVLSHLSKALLEYRCNPSWFESFAEGIKEQHWDDDFQQGGRSCDWAIIALVFGWRDIFGLASMDVPRLGVPPKPNEECAVLRRIIGEPA